VSAKTKISPAPDYVAVGLNVGGSVPFSISYSSDGTTWTPSTLPVGNNGLGDVIFGEDKFVAITANNSNQAAYSTDGITWTATTLPSAGNWNSLAYGNGKFVAIRPSFNVPVNTEDGVIFVSSYKAAYSTDGITWTETQLPATGSWLSVTYGDGKFVAIARYSSTSAYSTDGITWTAGTMPNAQSWQQVTYGNGKFVALINDSTSFAYSSNGITWTLGSMPYSYENWSQIAYGDGKFVALINNSSKSAYSLDGVSWTASSMPSSQSWGAITYGDGKFVALAYGSTTTAYSTDGITWTTSTITAAAGWVSIAYAPALWRDMVAPYIKVSGVWKIAKAAYIKVAGAWRSWFLQGGILDNSFSQNIGTGANGTINTSAAQADGKVLISGGFFSFNGTSSRLVRLNLDGSRDASFSSSGPSDSVLDIAFQPDNKIIVGGTFTGYSNFSANYLARINSDGSLDSAFRLSIGSAFDNRVSAVAIQSDGKILVGGRFTTFNGNSVNRLVRLNSDGTIDSTFLTNIGTGANTLLGLGVLCIVVQPNGKILVSGDFFTFNNNTARNIVRLNSDGTLDTAFMTNVGTATGFNDIPHLSLQPDGKIIITTSANEWNGVQGVNIPGGLSKGVIRLSSEGVRESSFNYALGSGPQGYGSQAGVVRKSVVLPDGKIILIGNFRGFSGIAANMLIRINSDGSPDASFSGNTMLGASNEISTISLTSNQRAVIGGSFLSFNGVSLNRIAAIGTGISG
jgi:uncharacterized delta-60 repeat protein